MSVEEEREDFKRDTIKKRIDKQVMNLVPDIKKNENESMLFTCVIKN
jgi:hypothetical protein